MTQPNLFDSPMTRLIDHSTSIEAAQKVATCRTKLQAEILSLLLVRDMTDGELERLPQFEAYSPSTVRKRRSELYQSGRVVWTGEKRGGFKVWRGRAETTK